MSSDEFVDKFERGELGDDQDYFEWWGLVELYREGKLSLGKAAEVAGVRNKWEMLMLPNEKGVPIDYTAEGRDKIKNGKDIE